MSADSKHNARPAQTDDAGELTRDEFAAAARAALVDLRARAAGQRAVNLPPRRRSLPAEARPMPRPATFQGAPAGAFVKRPPPFGLQELADAAEAQLYPEGYEPPAPTPPTSGFPAAKKKQASQNRPKTGRPERPKGTRAQRQRVARRLRGDERARKHLAEWRDKCRDNGGHGVDLAEVTDDVWLTGWACSSDQSSKSLMAAVRLAPNTAGKHALLAAGLNFTRDGLARYRFKGSGATALRARRIATLGVLQLMLKKKSKQLGPWGGGVVRGIPQGAFCAMLRDVFEPRPEKRDPHPNTVFGKYHRKGASAESGEVGYYQALYEAGFGYREQPKPSDPGVQLCETAFGPYCTSRYRICHAAPERSPDRFRDLMMQRLGVLAAFLAGERALERELDRIEAPRPPPD
jgi:hypothetical protein